MNFNKVFIGGRLTRDPELKHTTQGTAVGTIGMAVNRVTGSGDEKKEEVTFIDVTLWGKTAELVEKYFKKGREIFIEGRLQLDSWTDGESGKKRTKLKIVGERIEFVGNGKKDDERPAASPARGRNDDPDLNQEAEDIPF